MGPLNNWNAVSEAPNMAMRRLDYSISALRLAHTSRALGINIRHWRRTRRRQKPRERRVGYGRRNSIAMVWLFRSSQLQNTNHPK
jgi:hypothetical protein